MAAKWSPKGAQGHLLGSVKTMAAGIVREAYGEVSGRVGEATFPDCLSRPSLEVSWGVFLKILGDFGFPLGALGAPFGSLRGPEIEEWRYNWEGMSWKRFGKVLEPFWKRFGHHFVIILS